MIANWKRSLISCVAAMAVAGFGVSQADAQHGGHGGGGHGGGGHGGGGHGGGGHGGGGHGWGGHGGGGHGWGGHGGGGHGWGGHSLGHLHLGYGGYGGYGNYGYYPSYGNGYYNSGTTYYTSPAVVQNVVPLNTVPYAAPIGVTSTGGTIRIMNPSDSGGVVSYTLNGTQYSIQPGHAQTIQNDRLWTVAFGSGGVAGNVRYSLQPATYKFKVTDGGWNLFKAQEQTNVANNPLPPAPVPEPLNDEPRSVRVPINVSQP